MIFESDCFTHPLPRTVLTSSKRESLTFEAKLLTGALYFNVAILGCFQIIQASINDTLEYPLTTYGCAAGPTAGPGVWSVLRRDLNETDAEPGSRLDDRSHRHRIGHGVVQTEQK